MFQLKYIIYLIYLLSNVTNVKMDETYKTPPSPQEIIANYYRTLDTPELQPELVNFFRDNSILKFNGVEFLGTQSIVARLVPADLHEIVHYSNSEDYQPLSHGEYLASVLGTVVVDGGAPIKFSTVFVLDNIGTHGYYIKYQIVRSNIFNTPA